MAFFQGNASPSGSLSPIEAVSVDSLPFANGTKIKWELITKDYECSRTAIQTKKGVLQVKNIAYGNPELHEEECTCPLCEYHYAVPQILPNQKKMFADYNSWRESLPYCGTVTITPPDNRPKPQRNLEKYIDELNDVEKLHEIIRNFKINTRVRDGESLQERLDTTRAEIDKLRKEYNTLTNTSLADNTSNHSIIRAKVLNLNTRILHGLGFYKSLHMTLTESDNPTERPTFVKAFGTRRLRAVINEIDYEVAIKSDVSSNEKIALSPVHDRWRPARLFNNIHEITHQMGNPYFYVIYRRRRLNINVHASPSKYNPATCPFMTCPPLTCIPAIFPPMQVQMQSPETTTKVKVVTTEECGCRSDGLYCDTHLYE